MTTAIEADCLSDARKIAHGFFTRHGGVSTGLYASLNCGLGSKDERAKVLENRGRVAEAFGASGSQLLTCHQWHSADAIVVTDPWAPDALPKADAMVTRTPGIVLGALAADCAPVLFADPVAGVVGAAHAGWKGALGGVLEATIAAMESIGARRSRIRAALGPCIGADAYEVGPEFEATFIAKEKGHQRFFRRARPDARPYFDLPGFVLDRLGDAGLDTVESAHHCTYEHDHDFFSYRRTTHRKEPDYGRQISAIMLRM
ncbi:MAG TPA: peptidoglycan editing factor PgeF [Hyphomicrobiaceae bacterium]|nr:peptidoglycan editing factor PgeF [Hyphomicrobiaceae bacterium]